jgi:hypothetical protein
MAIAHVQTVSAAGNAVTSVTTAAITTTSGNLLHASLTHYGTFVSFTDSKGNTWATANAEQGNGIGTNSRQLYAKNCVGGAGHTFTLTISSAQWPTLAVTEISGLDTSSPLHQAAGAVAPSPTTTHSSGSITTLVNDTILIGSCGTGDATTLHINDPDYVERHNNPTDEAFAGLMVSTRLLTAQEANDYAPETTSAVRAIVHLAAYAMAAPGGGGVNVVITVPTCRDVFV